MSSEKPQGATGALDSLLMSDSASAVVPVQATDAIDDVVARVRETGARSVQLLIPQPTPALQSRRGFKALRLLLQHEVPGLLVISSDPQVLEAARAGGVETLEIGSAPPAARVYDGPPPIARPSDRPPAAPTPIDERDAEFLRALDDVPAADQYADLSAADASFAASLDDLSDVVMSQPPSRGAPEPPLMPPAAERPRRYRADDADLMPDETRRPGRAGGPRATALPRATAAPRTTDLLDDDFDADARRWRRKRAGISPLLIGAALLVVLVLIGIGWALNNRVTVTVARPSLESRQQPFAGEVIPYSPQAPGANPSALQAAPVSALAEFTAQGQVTAETVAPTRRAAGQVTIFNTTPQTFPLPEGTELLATNAAGAEVRFALDQPATIPAAVTTQNDQGSRTENGQVTVAVTARSPGSASNVGPDSITRLLIPGLQPLERERSGLRFRHAAIEGGVEEPQRVVTEADVQRVLGDALTGLFNAGVQQLRAQIDEAVLTVDATTVSPGTTELASPSAYEPPVVSPPVGSTVDPGNPTFSLTVRTTFSALATPRNRTVSEQLQTVVPQYFSERGMVQCRPGERASFDVAKWRWDGSKLTIDGTITCTPSAEVAPETLAQVRSAVVGQSREAAEARLQELQRQGLIGEYRLPEVATLPNFEFLVEVQVAP